MQEVDEKTLQAIHAYSSPFLDALVTACTQLGGSVVISLVVIAVGWFLWMRGRYRTIVFLVASVGGAGLVGVVLKAVFQRDRPDLWQRVLEEANYSFPSGHAMGSLALALGLMVVFWPTRWRWLVVVLGGVYVATIGLSRLYLGVHYPSDIVAGWVFAAAWVAFVWFVLRRAWGKRA
jgi:membrane-associated phospholipid phosphatase